eukprot:IDg19515t1
MSPSPIVFDSVIGFTTRAQRTGNWKLKKAHHIPRDVWSASKSCCMADVIRLQFSEKTWTVDCRRGRAAIAITIVMLKSQL